MTKFQSFRDPQGKVVFDDTEVWRIVYAGAADLFKKFLDLKLVEEWQEKEKIIQTRAATADERAIFTKTIGDSAFIDSEFSLFRHNRIDFPSFPYEWPPEMLYEAGKLTLETAAIFLKKTGWSIKDASPFNILFSGPTPIFIDLLSFEQRNEKDPLWLPYNQFVQSFLLPLLVNKEIGLSLRSVFLTDREGLRVSDAANLFGKLKKLKPLILLLVTLPHLLMKRAESDSGLYKAKELDSAEKAQFVLRQSFRRLSRQLEKVAPNSGQESNWTEYTNFNRETIPDYMRTKQTFLEMALSEFQPNRILDVGCNTGFFSLLAARMGASVVAIDYDEAVVGQVYRSAKAENLDVLPLVVNLSKPTPRLGWRSSENPSFLDRATGRFELVMMLAVVHHMLVSERIPLREIFRLAADLTNRALIVEFVPPGDKMFKRLTRGRDHLHEDLTAEKFTQAASEFFDIVNSQNLPQTERQIYLMTKK